MLKEIQNVKNAEFKAYLSDLFDGMDTVSIPYQYGSDTTVTVTVPINNNKPISISSRFIKPTVEEVRAYCDENGYTVNPESFVDHYESNGWMIGGKSHMKDWKSAVRNWQRREKDKPTAVTKKQENKFSKGMMTHNYDPSIYEDAFIN